MARRLHPSAGVSLIEALVAMAVMGVGTLAVLGAQTTLRFNADLSKQRSEAVRIAQEQIEQDRAFGDFAGYTNDITETAPPDVVSANATFSISRSITESNDLNGARMKALRVTVAWEDRAGQPQQVSLVSAIHGSPPALAGSLLLAAQLDPASTPGGRHRGIPPGAVPVPNTGSSRFSPPGAPEGVGWIFNNATGVITSICTSASPDSCTATNRRYLGGVIRFATGPLPEPQEGFDTGETPQGPDSSEADLVSRLGVRVDLIAPSTPTASCYAQTVSGSRAYHCAVPVDTDLSWRGNVEVTGFKTLPYPQELAETVADATAGRYGVCRYTPVRGCHPKVPLTGRTVAETTIWGFAGAAASCTAPSPQTEPPTPSRLMRNDDFPLEHANVRESLFNQNFLIRKAADACPADGPAPQFNTNTWYHQPSN